MKKSVLSEKVDGNLRPMTCNCSLRTGIHNMEPGAQTLQILSADGHIVPATLVSAGSGRIVIMSHGITGDRDEEGVHSEFADLLLNHGFDSVRFDFRGHGESTMPSRCATIAGMMLDFMAVVRWTRKNYRDLFHVATSFGASITLLCAGSFSLSDITAVAFWNPVIEYGCIFIDPVSEWGRKYFVHKNREALAHEQGTSLSNGIVIGPRMMMEMLVLNPEKTHWPQCPPLLIIHGDRDTCVPYEHARLYARNNSRTAVLHTLAGADHGFGGHLSEAFEVTLDWFQKILHSAGRRR